MSRSTETPLAVLLARLAEREMLAFRLRAGVEANAVSKVSSGKPPPSIGPAT